MKRGEYIAAMRQKNRLTEEGLAAKLNVSVQTVKRWEAGELPDSEYILPLAEALGISADDILKEETEESYYEKLNRKMGYPQVPKSPNYNLEERGSNGYFRAERVMGYVIMSLFMLYVVIFFGRELSSWLNRPRALTLENCKDIIEIEIDPADQMMKPEEYIVTIRTNKAVHDLQISFTLIFVEFTGALEDDVYSMRFTKTADYLREGGIIDFKFETPASYYFYRSYEITAVSGVLE